MAELYGSLSIDNGLRKIGVNDNGDYIELSINDAKLQERFADLIKWFDDYGKEMKRKEQEFEQEFGEEIESTEAVLKRSQIQKSIFTECCEKIDQVFGKDTCTKVFGDIIPDDVLIVEFFDQMAPILEKMLQERDNRNKAKYTRGKTKKARKPAYEETEV